MKYIQITNNPDLAKYISDCGVDLIMVDLETIGKSERQKNLDTLKSNHNLEDIIKIKRKLKNTSTQLITRINPLHEKTKNEIDTACSNGTDYIMLPMFSSKEEVEQVIHYINNRVKLILLFETPGSIHNVDTILKLNKIDEAYIGLNDLSIAYKLKFMFELLPSSLIELLATKFKEKKIPFGIGGISRIGSGQLDPKLILSEHVRLGSRRVIISRSFTERAQSVDELMKIMNFKEEISLLNAEHRSLEKFTQVQLEKNKTELIKNLQLIKK